jgi:hypothetical protein
MIIISLFGGLGNQMFQYACGKAVAAKLGVELKLDVSYLIDRTQRENFTFRNYELAVFNISEEIANVNEVRDYIPNLWKSSKFQQLAYKIIRLYNGNNYYFEKLKFQFESRIATVKDNSYLYGYFQTEKYFLPFKKEIIDAFQLKSDVDSVNRNLIDKIKTENSISIHIRRGDYQLSPFNLLEIDSYYRLAIEYIQREVESPKFYIFTNDYDWTETNFAQFDIDKTIVKHNQGEKSFMDMILMSNCKHSICANSSFSWWGAWLNQNLEKIIITPKQWFKTTNGEQAINDLVPETWIKI